MSLPFGPDEPLMGSENNTCSPAKVRSHLGLRAKGFADAVRSYADAL